MANLTHEEQQQANTATKRARRRDQSIQQKVAAAKKSGQRVNLWSSRARSEAVKKAAMALTEAMLIPGPHEAAVSSPAKALANELAGQLKPPTPKFESGKKISGAQLAKVLSDLAVASTDVLGPSSQALTWLKEHPVPALDAKTPAALIADGWGNAVVDYLDELRYGSRG